MPPVPGPPGDRDPKQSSQLSSFSDDSAHVNHTYPHYEDPAGLLRVIPLANYAPTARVAQHISPHTVAYPSPYPTQHLYQQYTPAFQAMDHPNSQQDWSVRNEAERRLAGMLQGNQAQCYSVGLPPSTFNNNLSHQHSGQPVPAIPYAFLPSYLPPSSSSSSSGIPTLPLTPNSTSPSPATSHSFFEDLVSKALARPAAVPAPPTISRAISRIELNAPSPDPDLMSPSPIKRRKAHHPATTQTRMPYPNDAPGSSLSAKEILLPPAVPIQWHPSADKISSQVIVQIPHLEHDSPPLPKHQEEDDDEEGVDWEGADQGGDGDWNMEKEDVTASPGMYGSRAQTVPVSVRTGERDSRSVRQKFLALLEDIFEAADSLPAELDSDSLNSFFDRLSSDGTAALLTTDTVERITRYVLRLNAKQTSGGKGVVWDEESLKRVFRILERTMRDANVDPFPSDKKTEVKAKKAAKKGKKGKVEIDSSQDVESLESGISELGAGELRQAEATLVAAAASMRAVECSLACLDSEGLSKPMYSEDLLATCVGQIKHQLSSVIFPVIEGMAGDKTNSRYLSHLVKSEIAARKTKSLKLSPFFVHPSLSAIAQSASAAFRHLSALISRPDLTFSDTLVIQTVYLATAPLFVTEPAARKATAKDKGKAEGGVMKSLRMEALGCLRGAFAKYADQRQWIIEEILSSLIKLPDQKAQAKFQLGDGSSMNTITALLLQLIQASSHGVSSRIKKLKTNASEMEAGGKVGAEEEARVESDAWEIRLCQEATDAAYRTAKVVAGYLIQKSSSSKANKTTQDTDYKAILDKFIEDILASLYRPEWPAAAVFLSVFSRLMITGIEDPASSAEATATKNMALDHLGSIAARLKGHHIAEEVDPVPSLDQIISAPSVDSFARLLRAHQDIHAYLVASSREDSMFASADDLSSILWSQELQSAIDRSGSVIAKLAAENTDEAQQLRDDLQAVYLAMRTAADASSKEEENVFGVSDPKQSDNVVAAAASIARHRPLQLAFEPILHALLISMDLSAVALRAKALKGLSTIVQVDPDVLGLAQVRQAFEARLSDSSPAVREPAVDLVGKYMLQKPSLAAEYYPHIALRVNDTGLAVRKKVIKLLKDIFAKTEARDMRKDICCKMVEMISDDDHVVRDMAVKGLAEMLHAGQSSNSRQESAALLVGVIAHYKGPQELLEDALQKVAEADMSGGNVDRSEVLVEALIQRLIDATEEPDFDAVSHIRAISFLCGSKPDIIGSQRAAVLLNYLRQPPANSDEQAGNNLLLRIFRLSIPTMPRTASSFATELSAKLVPMISRVSGGFPAIKEIIGAFCAVTTHLTKDYARLIQILRACEAKLQSMEAQYRTHEKISQPPQIVNMMLWIVALFAEYCNLDQVAVEDHAVKMELVKISERPLFEHLFDLFLDFSQMNIPQTAPTTCIGCLTRTYPSLVLRDETHTFMDRVFASTDFDNHARLFGVMHEFLVSEAKRKASGASASKDMDALIGSASELSESGVSTAIVQRNIQHILDGAKSHHVPTQTAALDVLAFTVNQGLYHPLQCMPILISLETHEDPLVSTRALELHTTLHRKHSTLVNVRYLDFARASYEYQRGTSTEISGHRDGVALLTGWFGLLGEKRGWKLDFLKALCRAFDYDSSRTTSADVGLSLYLSETLATFEYRQQEEVMVVIQQLSNVVSTSTPLVSTLEAAVVSGQPEDGIEGKDAVIGTAGTAQDTVKADRLINSSIIVALALLTKNHLLNLYTLTEDKCLKQATVKKSVLGDKAAVRKGSPILGLGRIPLVRGVETVQAFSEQQATFLQLIHEDGTIEA